MIMTVLGQIEIEELGFTSMHEHVLMDGLYMYEMSKDIYPKHIFISETDKISLDNIGFIKRNGTIIPDAVDLQDEDKMLLEVEDFKLTGGESMLDCTVIGLRCNLPGVKRIAEKTGVHIIESTGFYMEPTWPKKYIGLEVKDYEEIMFNEIKAGIEDTGIYPGAIKIGMRDFTSSEEKTLRAAAHVCKETNMCLTLHPPKENIIEAIDILINEGAKPEKIVIAHVGGKCFEGDMKRLITEPDSWKLQTDYCFSLLDKGVNLSMEFFGNATDGELFGDIGSMDWIKMACLYKLIEKGFAKQLVLGADICTNMSTRRGGGEGYTRITLYAIHTMRNLLKLSETIINTITVENPARILAY